MKNLKIKALGIAPYESMKNMMEKLAENEPLIDLDVYVGDLSKGVGIVHNNIQEQYDVIISRGGTAEMIEKISPIPVMEIELSVYDILRAIKLAENYSKRFAIVGFSSLTKSAHLLCDLLQYDTQIVTLTDETQVESVLKNIIHDGYHIIICDMISNTTAKRLGLNSILVTSGSESIESAFQRAIKLCSSYASIKERKSLYEASLRAGSDDIVIFNEKQDICFSTLDSDDSLIEHLRRRIPEAMDGSSKKSYHMINDKLYSIQCLVAPLSLHTYAVFHISKEDAPENTGKGGISFTNIKEAEKKYYNSIYSITNAMDGIRSQLDPLYQTSFPVMIYGESGTGQDEAAREIYTHSPRSHYPMVTLDLSIISHEILDHMFERYDSPVNSENNTIYFKNIHYLTQQGCTRLLSNIINNNLTHRCRLLFSCVANESEPIPSMCSRIINELSCLWVHTSSLRARKEEIPAISSLYLNNLNLELSHQIIGIEPEGMEVLKRYDWPGNYTQFKRVINELSVMTNTPYIKTSDVIKVLDKEKAALSVSSQSNIKRGDFYEIEKNKTLSEITSDIIRQVLMSNNGNQSTTARQLGISRTTLWRYLNEK